MAEGGTNSEGPPSIGNVITQTPAEYRTLLVQGLAPEISNDFIELYFEKPKYGGGDKENFSRESDTQARIVYEQHGSKISFLTHFNLRFTMITFEMYVQSKLFCRTTKF